MQSTGLEQLRQWRRSRGGGSRTRAAALPPEDGLARLDLPWNPEVLQKIHHERVPTAVPLAGGLLVLVLAQNQTSSFPGALGFSTASGRGREADHEVLEMLAFGMAQHLVAHAGQLRMASGTQIQKSLCLNPEFPAHSRGHMNAEGHQLPQHQGGPSVKSLTSQWHLPLFSGASGDNQGRAKTPVGPGSTQRQNHRAACVHTAV